jgi:hypothetical protein
MVTVHPLEEKRPFMNQHLDEIRKVVLTIEAHYYDFALHAGYNPESSGVRNRKTALLLRSALQRVLLQLACCEHIS